MIHRFRPLSNSFAHRVFKFGQMLVVAGFAARNCELLVRNACLIDEIEPLIPQIEPVLEPLRKYMLVATVL